jgi:hypothetical protein
MYASKEMLKGREHQTYLLGGGDDILRPPVEGFLSPTDMFLASTVGSFPVATLSLLMVSSAGAVLNWIKDCLLGPSEGRRTSRETFDTVIEAR